MPPVLERSPAAAPGPPSLCGRDRSPCGQASKRRCDVFWPWAFWLPHAHPPRPPPRIVRGPCMVPRDRASWCRSTNAQPRRHALQFPAGQTSRPANGWTMGAAARTKA